MPIVRRSGPASLLILVMGDDGCLFPSDFCYFVVYSLALVTLITMFFTVFVAYRLIFQGFFDGANSLIIQYDETVVKLAENDWLDPLL